MNKILLLCMSRGGILNIWETGKPLFLPTGIKTKFATRETIKDMGKEISNKTKVVVFSAVLSSKVVRNGDPIVSEKQ